MQKPSAIMGVKPAHLDERFPDVIRDELIACAADRLRGGVEKARPRGGTAPDRRPSKFSIAQEVKALRSGDNRDRVA